MPREVTRYLCDFKCHTPAKAKRDAMVAHEVTCLKNPSLRACTTCKNEEHYKETEDHPELAGCPIEEWMVRSCKKGHAIFEQLFHEQGLENSAMYIPPIKNCPYWENKKS